MTTSSAILAVQTARRTVYAADATLLALLGSEARFYDGVPERQSFPYVALGDAFETQYRTMGGDGNEVTFTDVVWTQDGASVGYAEGLAIASRMIALLDTATPIAVTGYSTILVNHEHTEPFKNEDGTLRGVSVRFRAIVQAS